MLEKIQALSLKVKIIAAACVVLAGTAVGTGIYLATGGGSTSFFGLGNPGNIITGMLSAQWPDSFSSDEYVEPEFVDDANRTNNAFNVADFGEQGSNGWFYRYGNADKPWKSKQMEIFDGGSYLQRGIDGLEMKSNFVHTGSGVAPILEWRVAKTGNIDLKLTYVKNANGDANPSFPDGVYIKVYKGDELLESSKVDIKVEEEVLHESSIPNLAVEEGESLYIAVDPNNNNAYDGGALYVAVSDAGAAGAVINMDPSRKDNNANNVKDYGAQGSNGWCYMYGKDVAGSAPVSDLTEDGYINNTSPGLVISKEFIHPAINDNAILRWTPAVKGEIEIRGKYTKYEHNDGNPDWPDGVIVQVYLNEKKLFEEAVKVPGPGEGANEISFSQRKLQVTPQDNLYFVVNANGNSTYDGGGFNISIKDRSGMTDENSVVIDESEIRQNVAKASVDFGAQGNNGWFFQEGYEDEPFGAYNIKKYEKDEKYSDDSYLEIKRDFVNTGENGESAVIKWKVAQDGVIKIDASYTKFKNEDKNPDWPDGTRVTLYHNNTVLVQKEFAPDVSREITKDLNVASLAVKRNDYITMVINGKENNAYDAGSYSFAIDCLSGLVGQTEKDIEVVSDSWRTNNASVADDFGKQGDNGWFFQYGYHTDPFFAVNIEKYSEENENYTTKDGIEIKRDYVMPSTKDKSANIKWKVAQDGRINIYADYTKLENEDANPSWPDGTVVTLFHNSEVLSSRVFEPELTKVKDDLSVFGVDVKKGDYITMIVNGRENTAYDAGLYYFVIEEANEVDIKKVNNSGKNWANLAADFGGQGQGNNGWYYLEGESIKDTTFAIATAKDGGICYKSPKVRSKDLELGKEFVQPGPFKDAMYQWVVACDGEVDITGKYTKFGHQDNNPKWPDGVRVRVYRNWKTLSSTKVPVLAGDGKDVTVNIEERGIGVLKGDELTFVVDALENNAWDGGRLEVQIKPHISKFEPGPDNTTSLKDNFGEQGNDGWYYGFGNSSAEFEAACLNANGDEYNDVLAESLLLKKDGVHPGKGKGAIYRWVAGENGDIDLTGLYKKSPSSQSDGVKIAVYKNGSLINGMSYDVKALADKDNVQRVVKSGLAVEKGDIIDFIITEKGNAEYDYGVFSMKIEPSVSVDTGTRTNEANLRSDFRDTQGNNGWYYGKCNWEGKDFAELTYNSTGAKYEGDQDEKLGGDYVEPGYTGNNNAAYKWIAAEDGKIKISGSYTLKKNTEDWTKDKTDGVLLRIFVSGDEMKCMGAAEGIQVNGLRDTEVTVYINEVYDVLKGEPIIFAVDPVGDKAGDWGVLAIDISPVDSSGSTVTSRDNNANLKDDFGRQGNNGWYYGTCKWNGQDFAEITYDDSDPNDPQYKGSEDELLKADYVEPGKNNDHDAAYKWVAAEPGKIRISLSYTQKANSADPQANGVCLRIFKNGAEDPWINDNDKIQKGGLTSPVTVNVTREYTVDKGDSFIFAVNPEGNNYYDGGDISIDIKPVAKKMSLRQNKVMQRNIKTMIATDNANTYENPSKDSTIVGAVKKGEKVRVIGQVDDTNWFEIEQDDGEGGTIISFIEGEFLSEYVEPEESSDDTDEESKGSDDTDGTILETPEPSDENIETESEGSGDEEDEEEIIKEEESKEKEE